MSTDWHSLPADAPPETHIAMLDARQRDLARLLKAHRADKEVHLTISADQRDLMLRAIERERWLTMGARAIGWVIAGIVAIVGLVEAINKSMALLP